MGNGWVGGSMDRWVDGCTMDRWVGGQVGRCWEQVMAAD